MRVKDIMSKNVTSCTTRDSLATAARAMWDQDCGVIPVTSEDGRLAGIITDRDICMAAYTKGATLSEISVANAMAKEIFSCHDQDDVDTALDTMRSKQIRRLPVVDRNNVPIGVLSLSDLARAAVQKDAGRKGLDCESVMQTFADVCEPRAHVAA